MESFGMTHCRIVLDFSSPSLHEDALKERELRIRDGKDKFGDWVRPRKTFGI
jgi:hypothetical protein